MATEIALSQSADTPPTSLRGARGDLSNKSFHPHDLAELAAAVATEEVRSGHDKKARKLLGQALTSPTENAVAQARFSIPREALQSEGAHEARARQALSARDWHLSLDESTAWFDDQPFSHDAAGLRSYVASVGLEDFPVAIEAAESGLRANPRSATLLNNLAFAAASNGEVARAIRTLDRARAVQFDSREEVYLTATAGLVAFREGDPARGRALYEKSVLLARKLGSQDLVVTAKVFLAMEEVRARSTSASAALAELERLRTGDDVTRTLMDRVRSMAKNLELP
jgi:tetratricopeptide (TPR) repeat protein